MRQQTLASQAGFERYGKKTRREKFLEEMDGILPWAELESLIGLHYPNSAKVARRRVERDVTHLLTAALVQPIRPGGRRYAVRFAAPRKFAAVYLGREPAPDETTILNFRHLLEKRDLCGAMLEAVWTTELSGGN